VAEREVRTYAGKSAVERAAERRRALVEAALELIAQDGWTAPPIERVCRQAALNKRYFYESFDTVESLLDAVLDELAAESVCVTLAAMEIDAPLPARIRAGIAALVHYLVDDPRRARILFGDAPADRGAATHRTTVIHQIVAAAVAKGRSMYALENDQQPMLQLAASVMVGGTRQAVLDFLDGQPQVDLDEFIDELALIWQAVGDAAVADTNRRAAVRTTRSRRR